VFALYILCCALDIYIIAVTMHTSHPIGSIGWEIPGDVLVGWFMWREHREPKAARTVRRIGPIEFGFRIVWIALTAVITTLALLPGQGVSRYAFIFGVNGGVWGLCRISMAYITILDVEGEKGRAAKMSLAKLKEMFGTSWVPAPQGA